MSDFRIEHDSMGEVQVPARRAVAGTDPARGRELPDQRHAARAARTIHALALVKAAAARVNAELGRARPTSRPSAIDGRGREVAAGEHDDHFPIDVFQTGSGTSSNMNINEVLASLAAARRASRCTPTTTSTPASPCNDTFPTAIHVAAALAVTERPAARARRRSQASPGGARPRSSPAW